MNVVADTGVLLAAVDADDRRHQDCSEVLASRAHSLVVPAPVVTETSWMIESVLGPAAEASFVTAVGLGELAVIDLDRGDYTRCAELIDRYADLDLAWSTPASSPSPNVSASRHWRPSTTGTSGLSVPSVLPPSS